MSTLAISVMAQGDQPAYDGPFDVLLSMIRQNRYPIECLPVAVITGEFLEYIRSVGPMDDDLSGQFIETASWLVLLKSRSMLPPEDDPITAYPQEELRRALMDYAALKESVEFLKSRGEFGDAAAASKGFALSDLSEKPSPEITLKEVVARAQRARTALNAARDAASLLNPELITVENQLAWIESRLDSLSIGAAVNTEPWFCEQSSQEGRVTLLLALLEEAKSGRVLLHQTQAGSYILIKRAV